MTRYELALQMLQENKSLVTCSNEQAENDIREALKTTYKTFKRNQERELNKIVVKAMKYREQLRKALFIN